MSKISKISTLKPKKVLDAFKRIQHRVVRTPILQSTYFNEAIGCNVYFKCENFQRTGAFKFRGATNAMDLLDRSITSVVTHSSGNHASGLTKAGVLSGRDVHVVMPSNAPIIKQNIVRGYGGHITLCEPSLTAREETARRIQQETGAALIHSYNDENVIYGQGTQAVELMEDVPDLDCILAPIGGGGMISGITLATLNSARKIAVIGCEPDGADDAFQSKQKGEIVPLLTPKTIADGLRMNLGSNTFPIVMNHVHSIITVKDQEIIEGMKAVYERMKIIIEPSCGVGPAVLLSKAFKQTVRNEGIKNVGVILSGGNIDLKVLRDLF